MENNILNKEYLEDVHYIQLNYDKISRDPELYKESTKRSIINVLKHHVKNNSTYRQYFENTLGSQVNLEQLDNMEVKDIPLIPSGIFKEKGINLSSVKEDEIVKYCTSSGTLGSLSIVPRDNMTLINIFTSIYLDMLQVFEMRDFYNYRAFILGPSPEEAKDLWFAYAISSMAFQWETNFFQKGQEYSMENIISELENSAIQGEKILLMGPPPRIMDLCSELKRNSKVLSFHPDSIIVSAGGWKRRQSESISREEYNEEVSKTFSLDKTRIKDVYNMVESNSMFSECENNFKHIPPWVDAYARDPATNEVLPDGELGIISFYDASANSYPGFILSEDFGKIYSSQCKCGRYTKRIEIVRRMDKVESRGCALKMDSTDK